MPFKFRPQHFAALVAVPCLIAAVWLLVRGGDRGVAGMNIGSYYNWMAIVPLLVVGVLAVVFGLWALTVGAEWPAGLRRRLGARYLRSGLAPGQRAQYSRLLLAGPVPAKDLQSHLERALAPSALTAQEGPTVQMLQAEPGSVLVGYGAPDQAPLWTVSTQITPQRPCQSRAVVEVVEAGADGSAGAGVDAGEQLDRLFDELTGTVQFTAPLVQVERRMAASR